MSHSDFLESSMEPPKGRSADGISGASDSVTRQGGVSPQGGPNDDTPGFGSQSIDSLPAMRPRPRYSLGLTSVLLVLLLVLLMAILARPVAEMVSYSIRSGQLRAEYESSAASIDQINLTDFSHACQLLQQRVGPSVVNINSSRPTSGLVGHDSKRLIEQPWPESLVEGQGSGVILDTDGHIVTNYHVVRDAVVEVTLADGRVLTAKLVGADLLTDLAVLKIEADGLLPAEWGDSDELRPGSLVWALGSPFGLEQTITFGILSAKNRSWFAGKPHQDFLQSDVAINPGNSGGPLVDVRGRVVGINTAIVGEAYQGVSFAIPSSVAREVYEQLIEKGQVSRGWLGVQLREVTAEQVEDLGLGAPCGAYVSEVVSDQRDDSPAELAGVEQGDLILRWNGDDIDTMGALMNKVAFTEIDSTVEMVVLRDGEEFPLEVVVGRRPTLDQ